MRQGVYFGISAVLLGVTALIFVIIAQYAESVRGNTSGYLLYWLDAHGMVRSPQPDGVVEFTNPSPFVLTDSGAIRGLLVYSLWFSVWSILLALWAEFKLENTLHLSVGVILGILTLERFDFALSLLAMGIVAVIVSALRWRHRG